MGLDRILADVEFFGDLSITHSLGDQFEDLEFPPRDAKILPLFLVWNEGTASRNRYWDFLNSDFLLRFGKSDTKPDAEGSKGGGDQGTGRFRTSAQ